MKKTVHYLLVFTGLLLGSRAAAQELVYEQDHGLSFNKGTINTDVLIQLIQEKQEELNKFMLSNLMKKAVENNPNSRVNNFTTKYLIYETMDELTIATDKSKFGKQTLELLKEAAIIFGISAVANDRFGDLHLSTTITGGDDKLEDEEFKDSINFNQTLDMVLNACIQDPKLSGYFPLYGKLANPNDPNRVWYETDSRYWSGRDTLQQEYTHVLSVVNELVAITEGIDSLRENIKEFPKGIFLSLETKAKMLVSDPARYPADSLTKFQQELQGVVNVIPVSLLTYTPKDLEETINKAKEYCSDTAKIRENAASLSAIIQVVKKYNEAFKNHDYMSVFTLLINKLKDKVLPSQDAALKTQMLTLTTTSEAENKNNSTGNTILTALEQITKNYLEKDDYGVAFIAAVKKLEYDYANWKRAYDADVFTTEDINSLLHFLDKNSIMKCKQNKIRKKLYEKLKSSKGIIEKNDVYATLKKKLGKNRFDKLTKKQGFNLYASQSRFPVLDRKLMDSLEEKVVRLHNLAERSGISELMLNLVSRLEKEGSLKGFFFEKQQVELTKDILNYYIDYVSQSGEFSVGSVFLKTLVDNISYKEADTIEHTSASLSLNFESVLFTLNDKIVTPEWSYRMRRVQPFIQIGVNYADFIGANSLDVASDGTQRALKAMSFASEKIGVKFKFINKAYTRSFAPGVVYKWNNHYYYWTSPPKMPFLNEAFFDVHAGGLLYNAVNLNTQKNFDFPFAGMGVGFKTFNGLSVSASYNMPFTHGLATGKQAWKDNSFIMLSLDIPIIEYIGALRKNK